MQIRSVLLIGPTGAGKTPLGNHIETHGICGRRCFHFDFGHELRSIAALEAPPENFTTSDHSFLRDVLEKGLLLENEHFPIAEKIIERFRRLRSFADEDTLLLNGLPRHIGQARDVGRTAAVENLIVLECSAEEVYCRIRENTGMDRTGRSDDEIEMIRKKLEIFSNRTEPLIDHYSGLGCKVIRIKATSASTAETMYSEVVCKFT